MVGKLVDIDGEEIEPKGSPRKSSVKDIACWIVLIIDF